MPKQHPSQPLVAGKLPATLLADLLADLPTCHPQLLLGPAVGEDAAVIDFAPESDRLLVAKSDPITFATDEIGYYAVNVCANDLAVTGATPRFYLPTLLLPVGSTDVAMVRSIFAQIGAACAKLNIVVAGGHSEVTAAVNQPVIAGTLLGEVARDAFLSSRGCRAGDVVLLAGQIPIEGASIIAREKRADLLARGWTTAEVDKAAAYLHDPGISILLPAQAAVKTGAITAMHDPTEGGIATGLYELAVAGGVGMEINLDAIPVSPLAAKLCATYGLDPLGTIASGALLATCAPDQAERVLQAWAQVGWPGTVIGHLTHNTKQSTPQMTNPVTGRSQTLIALASGKRVPFPTFAADEIIKLWA
ncbi:MAG: AIR synthase [Caldilineaceae bacterium]|nr:AIR synthase [Caldilineaceae bacterium]